MLTRRRVMTAITSFGIDAAMASHDVRAEGLVQHPVLKEYPPIRIAIPPFVAGAAADDKTAANIAQIVIDDLRHSGQFVPLDPSSFSEHITDIGQVPPFASWRSLNAWTLVAGQVDHQPDGRLKVQFRLWSVASGHQLIGWQYVASPDDWRSVAHVISDAVITQMTGKTQQRL